MKSLFKDKQYLFSYNQSLILGSLFFDKLVTMPFIKQNLVTPDVPYIYSVTPLCIRSVFFHVTCNKYKTFKA